MSTTAREVRESSILRENGFSHLFSTRKGGVSPPPFDSMNFGDGALPLEREENLRRLAGGEVAPGELYQATQVHGSAALLAEGDPVAFRGVQADALVARGAGTAVAVRIADCVPILVGDRRSGNVAAIHAGWRGVVAGVIPNALRLLTSSPEACVAAVGPSIGPCCFEVSREVAELIVRASTSSALALDKGEKAMVSLRAAVRSQLQAAGVTAEGIEDVPGCTRCDATNFYSYRRDGERSGRLLALIKPRRT